VEEIVEIATIAAHLVMTTVVDLVVLQGIAIMTTVVGEGIAALQEIAMMMTTVVIAVVPEVLHIDTEAVANLQEEIGEAMMTIAGVTETIGMQDVGAATIVTTGIIAATNKLLLL